RCERHDGRIMPAVLLRKCQELTINELIGATGFEPATPCAQGRCATRLRYAPTLKTQESYRLSPNLSDASHFTSRPAIDHSFRPANLTICCLMSRSPGWPAS